MEMSALLPYSPHLASENAFMMNPWVKSFFNCFKPLISQKSAPRCVRPMGYPPTW